MSRYAFIIASSENYASGIIVLCNSIARYHDNVDVRLLDFNLSEKTLNQLKSIDINIIIQKSENKNQIQATAIDRFNFAYNIGKEYDAICLMDADMFLIANCDLFFNIASKGFIVSGSNGMIINFNKGYQKRYNVNLGQDNYLYTKIHTTAPIFLSDVDLDWFKLLYDSKRIDNFDDFLYLNILGIQLKKYKKMVVMPPYCFTGIHHYNLKPVTGVIEKGGLVLSGTEEQIYMIHGKWWDKGWYNNLMLVMDNYFKDNNFSEKQKEYALNSQKIMLDEFNNYLRL